MPPVLLLLIAGIGAAIAGNYPILHTGWIFWSIVLFTLSGITFMTRVGPLQRKMLAQIRQPGGALDWAAYRSLSHRWEIWGGVALTAPALAAVLMVMKPALPGWGALLGK
jgi:uncharacterized membrane protein